MQNSREIWTDLFHSIQTALEVYSNVHRGSGQYSTVSTLLYEHAREIVLDLLDLPRTEYQVLFFTPLRTWQLEKKMGDRIVHCIKSREIGLPMGINAVVCRKIDLPKGEPCQTGGGTAKMVSPGITLWEDAPERFEAGTPAIICAIALARGLQLLRRYGLDEFPKLEDSSEFINTFEQLNRKFEKENNIRNLLIGKDNLVPIETGQRHYTNLDNGASTPTFLPVWRDAWQGLISDIDDRSKVVDDTKKTIFKFLGADSHIHSLIFAQNTTEALNLVALSLRSLKIEHGIEPVVVNSVIEHNSNELPWRSIPGWQLLRLEADADGFIDLEMLETLLKEYNQKHLHGNKRLKLIAISGASNVLGTFNDISAISNLAHTYGAWILVDAAQLVAHRPVDMNEAKIDFLTFSGHKIYAPFGSGGLIARKDLLVFQDEMLTLVTESGEENIFGISAINAILKILIKIGMQRVEADEGLLTRHLLEGMKVIPGIHILGIEETQSEKFYKRGGVIAFHIDGIPHNVLAARLAEVGGIGIRNGCFCAHIFVKRLMHIHPLRELVAGAGFLLGIKGTKDILPGLARVSLGIENNAEDVDHFLGTLHAIIKEDRTDVERIAALSMNACWYSAKPEMQSSLDGFYKTTLKQVYR